MYGKKGSELIQEFAESEPGQLAAFNTDLVTQVLDECNSHFLHLNSLVRKMNARTPAESSSANRPTQNGASSNTESPDDNEPPEADTSTNTELPKDDNYHGLLIHHQSLTRNKRCLMAYVYNRYFSEKEYFKNHAATIQSYMSALDLDLGVDMVPPKDPYIKVRVLDDIGNVVLSDQLANLARHAILFIRRTDAEQYISQGLMEELTS
ncbi:uncharacterized protein LOC132058011 [Lycium ferocissimum]|uniref:uncharacterized protein LOC132058011 n=1 Tax=Lycium ferocissimum TaxID=112874 RepID=UPI00281546B0|nr:uncharacterized protein LOC132058011 [Lycium ferocissimum]